MKHSTLKTRRLAFWTLTGTLTLTAPVFVPAYAAAEEIVNVSADKVPAPVLATARQQYLDSHDIDYRKEEGTSKYRVYFTTPTNIRVVAFIRADGTLQKAPELNLDQVKGGPKSKEERERLLADWNRRIILTQTPPEVIVVPQPAPPVQPPQPQIVVAPPAPVVFTNTPVGPSEIPAVALAALDKYTGGAKDVRYYRQQADATTRYESEFTTADGSRREVVVADNGTLIAGPLLLRETVTNDDLRGDLVGDNGVPQPTQIVYVETREVPARVIEVSNRYTVRASDVRYQRCIFPDRSVGYTVFWVHPDNYRRYYSTIREDGSVIVAPHLSKYQPDAITDVEGNRSARVAWRDVPDRVKLTFQPITRTDANAVYYRQVRDGKVSYGTEFVEAGKKMWMRVDESGKVIAGPVGYESGVRVGANRPGQPTAQEKLPRAVQETVNAHTQGGKQVVTTKRTELGQTVYHVDWLDAQNDHHEMRVDERGVPIVQSKGPQPNKK